MSTLTSYKDGSLGSGPNMSAIRDGSLGNLNDSAYENGSLGGGIDMSSYRSGSLGGCGCTSASGLGSTGDTNMLLILLALGGLGYYLLKKA